MTRIVFACTAAAAAALMLSGAPEAFGSGGRGAITGLLSGDLPPVSKPAEDPAVTPRDPRPDAGYSPWSDWAAGQSYTPLSRININLAFGAANIDSGPAKNYWESGPGFSMDLGYGFAPFLAVSLSLDYCLFPVDGRTVTVEGPGLTDDVMTSSGFNAFMIGAEIRLRLPFNLIGPLLFRFSKAREGLGLVPIFKIGFGLASVSRGEVEFRQGGTSVYETRTVWKDYTGLYWDVGLDVEIRWKYFGLSLGYSMVQIQRPDIAWGADFLDLDNGSPMVLALITLGVGVYF